MCTNEFKSTKAITLIALVISILVLLILAGVSVSLVVGETGITQRAVTAKKTYDIAGAKEQVELLVEGYIGDYYGKKYTSGESVSQDIGTYVATQLASDTTVGDYTLETIGANVTLKKGEETVAKGKINSSGALEWSNSLLATWEQDGTSVTNGDVTLTVGQAVTGYEVEGYESLNWFVLGAKDGKLLITTNTCPEQVTLEGKDGYTGGVATLNAAAEKYSDGDMANSTRTIDMADINRITGFDPETDGANVGEVYEYGNEVTYTLKDDGKVWYQGSKQPITETVDSEPDTSFEYYNGSDWITLSTGDSIDFICTYAAYDASFAESAVEALLFTNTGVRPGANGSYWLGSPYIRCNEGYALYGFHVVYSNQINGSPLGNSGGNFGMSSNLGLRPVVSLSSEVKVTSAGVISK